MNRQHCLALAAIVGVAFANSASAQNIGPSTTTEPYLVPTIAGVSVTSILTTGDSVGGYRMVGIPDGLGAWLPDSKGYGLWVDHKARSFDLVMDHEIGRTLGIPRAHASKGAFVSQWTIDRTTLKVFSGRDHMTSPNDMLTWNGAGYTPGTTALERLCSADLAEPKAYGLHAPSRIFLSGEETSPPFTADHGRVFAHIVDGPDKNKSFELPRLGKVSFENALASPFPDHKTIVMLNDDAGRETNVTPATNVCRVWRQGL
jgi:hypothetical protein